MEDPYATLGVRRSATVDEIKRVYRQRARELHPDVNGDASAEERFKKVSAAFDVLSDPAKRKLYDEFGSDGLRPGFDPARAHQQRWRPGPHFGGFGFGGFDDLFGGRADPRGSDARATLSIDLRDAVLGAEREIALQQRDGTKRLKVKIPAGIGDVGALRLSGQGNVGPGGAGDLLLEISVRPHPRVRRRGADLSMRVPVTVKEVMLGARIDVPTFHGPIKLTVPPASQSGDRLRVKGRGVGGGSPGDLFIILEVHVPTNSSAGAAAAEELDALYETDVRASLEL